MRMQELEKPDFNEHYNKVGTYRPHIQKPREHCPRCGKMHLRKVYAGTEKYTRNKRVSRRYIRVGVWCQGCGYIRETYHHKEPGK